MKEIRAKQINEAIPERMAYLDADIKRVTEQIAVSYTHLDVYKRQGYITACKELLHEIRTQRMPWSVNQLAIEAGHYLLSSSQ